MIQTQNFMKTKLIQNFVCLTYFCLYSHNFEFNFHLFHFSRRDEIIIQKKIETKLTNKKKTLNKDPKKMPSD